MIVYCDMDGVLCDFDGKIIELFGRKFKDFESKDIWNKLENNQDIFLTLKPMPDAQELIRGVYRLWTEYPFQIEILTAVPKYGKMPLSRKHKREWVAKHFPTLSNVVSFGPHAFHKQNHCETGDVLIDDSPLNIPQWTSRGGFGILHTDAISSLAKLDDYLKVAYK